MFLDWFGSLASYLWAHGYKGRIGWAALLPTSGHRVQWQPSMGDPTWEEGQVTPQVQPWGNCQQKIKIHRKSWRVTLQPAPDEWMFRT